jgi:hypothetical protein
LTLQRTINALAGHKKVKCYEMVSRTVQIDTSDAFLLPMGVGQGVTFNIEIYKESNGENLVLESSSGTAQAYLYVNEKIATILATFANRNKEFEEWLKKE